jgi:transposase-like protein
VGGSSPDKAGTCQHSLPKSAHPAATRAMQDIFNAEDGGHARIAPKAFQLDYGTKFPKAAAKITDDLDVLLEFTTTRPIIGCICEPRTRSLSGVPSWCGAPF